MLVRPIQVCQNKPSIGIIQGRLTSSRGRGIQFFPFDEWEEEFKKTAEVGLNEIEFIFDLERYVENPLWSQEGITRIENQISKTKVIVKSVCADFFMRFPPNNRYFTENAYFWLLLKRLTQNVGQIGAKVVEVPLLADSSLNTAEKRTDFIDFLNLCLPMARNRGITIAIETDLPPKDLLFLALVFNGEVRLVYDIGNSASLGYSPTEEIEMLGEHIISVHVKDRTLGGGTVPLGTGAVDFDEVFSMLAKKKYQGSFILQATRGEDGKEIETVAEQITFLRKHLEKYDFI